MRGIVQVWFESRAFGFAANEESGAQVFLHVKNFTPPVSPDQIHKGDRLEYSLVQSPKGLAATKIVLCRSSGPPPDRNEPPPDRSQKNQHRSKHDRLHEGE
jgi:cold shock CspA family protein